MHTAARDGHLAIVTYLKDQGADIMAKNDVCSVYVWCDAHTYRHSHELTRPCRHTQHMHTHVRHMQTHLGTHTYCTHTTPCHPPPHFSVYLCVIFHTAHCVCMCSAECV